MSTMAETIVLPGVVRAALEPLEGQTLAQKIARLVRNELRRALLDCEAELL